MRSILLRLIMCAVLLTGCGGRANGQSSSTGVKTIENIGSDTIVNLALAWAEAYQKLHPDLRISVTGGGSGTGIAALVNGTADIAKMLGAVAGMTGSTTTGPARCWTAPLIPQAM